MQSSATDLAAHPRRARALELMLQGATDREIAKELGCEPSTVWRWRVDPVFAKELRAKARERLEVLDDRMEGLVSDALDVIAETMRDREQPAMVRLRAAEAVLNRAAWSGGAQDRRIRAEVTAEVDRFYRTIVERCSEEIVDALVKATSEPWMDDADKKPPRRPHVVVRFPDRDKDKDEENEPA